NALPLAAKEKVAIVGDFARTSRYQGAGSSGVNPTKVDNTLALVRQYDVVCVGYEPGFKRFGKKNNGLIKKALMLAHKADTVVVYLGLDEAIETEGLDRQNMCLAQNQIDLLKALKVTGKKIIGVISSGSALIIDFAPYCDALIHAYLFGQAGAGAVLDVITGKVNPSGKLAETYPIKYEDCSSASNFGCSTHGDEKISRNVEYRESIFVGYRYYDTAGVKVRYPFGYGLSYTNFEYSNLKVTDKGAEFTIKNTGGTAGKEVAQLYIGLPESKIFRAKKELKGFVKVALEPNEEKTVTIPFDEYSFRYFNVATNKWEVEGGKYAIMVSSSSLDADIKLRGELVKKATTETLPYEGLELPSYKSGAVSNVSKEEFEILYGKELPDPSYQWIGKKKNRIIIDENTGVAELRWAKGSCARAFAKTLRGAYKFLKGIGNYKMANMLQLNLFNMPLRGFIRFGGMLSNEQLDGLVMWFNKEKGGFSKFMREGKIKKKRRKPAMLAKKAAEKEEKARRKPEIQAGKAAAKEAAKKEKMVEKAAVKAENAEIKLVVKGVQK
ncbi:MAG: glycoside hydrolase family 3 C-terminal domain-containing protein, partial [Firmicutes bacterium]|nr:glycoside hydrolase family 3 C-terminal domain-containing protein [Bacillota bacterium]